MFLTVSCTKGILVEPPTSITSSISLVESPASFNAFSQGIRVFSTKSLTKSSNFALDKDTFKCLGPDASAVKYGKLISV